MDDGDVAFSSVIFFTQHQSTAPSGYQKTFVKIIPKYHPHVNKFHSLLQVPSDSYEPGRAVDYHIYAFTFDLQGYLAVLLIIPFQHRHFARPTIHPQNFDAKR